MRFQRTLAGTIPTEISLLQNLQYVSLTPGRRHVVHHYLRELTVGRAIASDPGNLRTECPTASLLLLAFEGSENQSRG